MFGIGPMELVVICVIAIVVVGPKKLPDLMKQMGRFFVHARKYSTDIRSEINEVVRKAESEIRLEEAEKMRAKIQQELEGAKESLKEQVTIDAEHKEEGHSTNSSRKNNVGYDDEDPYGHDHHGDDFFDGSTLEHGSSAPTPEGSESYQPSRPLDTSDTVSEDKSSPKKEESKG